MCSTYVLRVLEAFECLFHMLVEGVIRSSYFPQRGNLNIPAWSNGNEEGSEVKKEGDNRKKWREEGRGGKKVRKERRGRGKEGMEKK